MLTKEKIISVLEAHKREIKSYGVKKIILFGSYAQDRAKKESDLDFLVEFKLGRGLYDDYVHLKLFLENIFKKEVDLIKPNLIREELKSEILEGKQIAAQI